MVPVSASTSFLSCPSTRSNVGGSKVLFPLILRIFQFCHKYKCKYYHKYKYKSIKKKVERGPPAFDVFFCLLFLLNHTNFVYGHSYKEKYIYKYKHKHEHTSKIQAQEVLFPVILRIFQCDGQLSVASATISPKSSVMCIAKMQSKVKGEVIRDFWQNNKQCQFPKQIHTMKELCLKR